MTDETQQPTESTAPRKRGRPSNADLAARAAAAGQTLGANPAPAAAKPVGDESLPGKRGPKPGRRKKGMTPEALENMAKQIQGLHHIASVATGLEELRINEMEAAMLSRALTGVSEEYGLSLSGKTGATLQLLGVMAMVYVPRLGAIKAKAAARKAQGAALHAVNTGGDHGAPGA